MRKTLIILAALILITGLALFFVSREPEKLNTNASASAPSTPDPRPSPPDTRPAPRTPPPDPRPSPHAPPHIPPPDPRTGRTADGKLILTQPAEMARDLNSPDTSVAADVEILNQLLWFYRKVYGENPVVENDAAVTQALLGNNPKGVVFIDPAHAALGENGALLDRFGNPYYFHAISGTEMDIVSPGPDGKRGTPDDTHLNPAAGQLE